MVKDCLYCGLQFAVTAQFCPHCGRPTESGFTVRSLQESEVDSLRRELKEKDELIQQLLLSLARRGEIPGTARSNGRRSNHGSRRRRASVTTHSSSSCWRKTEEKYGL